MNPLPTIFLLQIPPPPRKINDNKRNVDINTDLNEHPPNNVPVADPPPQQVTDNESNTDQSKNLNETSPNNLTVADLPLQQENDNGSNTDQITILMTTIPTIPVVDTFPQQDINEDKNKSDHDQQPTSVPHCGFETNFLTNVLKPCNTSHCRKSYMDLRIIFRINRVTKAAQNILAHNLCTKPLENDGIGYLEYNISLAHYFSVYFNCIKLFIIQDVMRININKVSNFEIPRPKVEASEDDS